MKKDSQQKPPHTGGFSLCVGKELTLLFLRCCLKMSAITKNDIASREDVKKLVEDFYSKVRADQLIGPIFSHVDWDHHTPLIIDFWAMVLLGEQSYKGNPFQKHIKLPLQPAHFERWLQLFKETIDENFQGAVANEAKTRADAIASLFQYKLGLIS